MKAREADAKAGLSQPIPPSGTRRPPRTRYAPTWLEPARRREGGTIAPQRVRPWKRNARQVAAIRPLTPIAITCPPLARGEVPFTKAGIFRPPPRLALASPSA